MAIPEAQLDTWSNQGAVAGSASTYSIIKNVLNDTSSNFNKKSYSLFLQGSYSNDTNVRRDSDVDVVTCLDEVFTFDTDALTASAKITFETSNPNATYSFFDFRSDVLSHLQTHFGSKVASGKKAIYIPGDGARRDADVVVCVKHRRYISGSTGNDKLYHEGISIYKTDGGRIDNFPKQHSTNCTTKHQATKNWFKPTVRIYKNIRNRMIEDNVLEEGVAPSYYIEGLLWNVPDDLYGTSYKDTFINTMNWIINQDKSKLVCANGLEWLVRDYSEVCWSRHNCESFTNKISDYWNKW